VERNAKYDSIKQVITAQLPGARVMLFGSRARRDNDALSDYDLLIITPETYSPREKVEWNTRLNNAIIAAVHIPVDLILTSEQELKIKQQLPSHVLRSAVQEGIFL
jgi:uncharacterized protein